MSAAGSLKYAYDWSTTQTVNGVTFSATSVSNGAVGANLTLSNFGGYNGSTFTYGSGAFNALPVAYKNMLVGSVYNGTTGTTGTVALNGLTAGRQYAVQVWVGDPRNSSGTWTRTENITSSGGNTQLLDFNVGNVAGGVGQYAIGYFTAAGASQAFSIAAVSGSVPQMNAMQLRDVTGVVGTWGGGTGIWDETTPNFTGKSFETVKAAHPIVVFGDVDGNGNPVTTTNVTVAAGGVAMNGLVSFTNTAAGVSYTINSADSMGITGTAQVWIDGGGTVTFAGANTYTGITNINAGTLKLGDAWGIPSGAGTGNVSLAGTLDLAGHSPTINGLSGAGMVTSSAAGDATLTLGGNNQGGTLTGVIQDGAGTVGLGKIGTGALYVNGSNTYSGLTTIDGGYIVARNNAALGTTAGGTIVNSGGTLQLEKLATDVTIAGEAVALNGNGVGGTRGALASWTGNNTWDGPVTLESDSMVFVQADLLRVTTAIEGFGGLQKSGDGSLTLTGAAANDYAGMTVLRQGYLYLDKTGAVAVPANTTVQMGAGTAVQPHLRMMQSNQFGEGVVMTFANTSGNWARFDLQGTTQTLAGISSPTDALRGAVIQNERLSGGGTSADGTLILNNDWDYSYWGYLRDEDDGGTTYKLNLVKNGSGTQELMGDRVNHTGTTTINAGTLKLTNATAFRSPTTVNADSMLVWYATQDWSLAAGATVAGAGTWQVTGSGVSGQGHFDVNNDMSGFTGSLTIANARYRADADNELPSGTIDIVPGGQIWLPTGRTFRRNVTLAGNGWLEPSGQLGAIRFGGGANWAGNITLADHARFTTQTTAEWGTISGVISGDYAVEKAGAGTLTLAGNNTYTGATTVTAGALELDNGQMAGGGDVFVANGAALAGRGAIAGNVTLAGSAQLVPGSAARAGTLALAGDLTFDAASISRFEIGALPATIGGGVNDYVTVGGMLTPNNSNIALGFVAAPVNGSYRLINAAQVSGGFNPTLTITANSRKTFALDQATAGQVNLVVSGPDCASLTWTGAGNGDWNTPTTNWDNGGTADRFYDLDTVTFDAAGAARNTVTIVSGSTVQPAVINVNSDGDYTFTGDGKIGGPASIVKSGAGTLTLANTGGNDFFGGVAVNQGVVKLGAANSLPVNSTVTVADGGAFDFAGQGTVTTRNYTFSIDGAGPFGEGALVNTGASVAGNASVAKLVLTADASIGGVNRWDIGTGAVNMSLDGGGHVLTKVGANEITVRPEFITNLAAVRIKAGLLKYESFSQTTAATAETTHYVEFGGTLGSYGNITLNMPVEMDGGTLQGLNGTGTWSGKFLLNVDTTVDTSGGHLVLSGVVGGPAGITKISATNTLNLNGANTYEGWTTLANGNLAVNHSQGLGDTGAGTVLGTGGATVNMFLGNGVAVAGEALTLNSNSTGDIRSNVQVSVGNTATWDGPITLAGPTGVTGLFATGTLTVKGTIDGACSSLQIRGTGTGYLDSTLNLDATPINKTDTGTWTVSSTGNVWGNTTVAVGTLKLAAVDALPVTTVVTMGQGDANNSTFDLNGFNQAIAGLGLNTTGGTKTVTSAAPATLTVNNFADNSYGGVLTGAGLSLVKNEWGTLTLSGANSFGGDITVNSGTLSGTVASALGTASNARTITVNSGAALSYGATGVFGAHYVTTVPNIVVDGGTLTNSGAFNSPLNNITLRDGTLTSASGNGTWGAWNINGTITSTGISAISAASPSAGMVMLMSGDAGPFNTSFDVQSDTLTVSTNVIDGREAASPQPVHATSLTKLGAGTLVLSGANTYSGGTAIQAGAVNIRHAAALGGTAAAAVVASGAALEIEGGISANAVPLTLNGSGVAGSGALRNVEGDNAYTGPITLASAARIQSDSGILTVSGNIANGANLLTVGGDGDTAVAAAIGGAGGLAKDGAGTLTISAAGNYSGGTKIAGGTLRLAAAPVTPVVGSQIWLDASTTTTGNLATWADQSGNSRHATQATAANQPTSTTSALLGGKKVVTFAAGQAMNLDLGFLAGNSYTIFAVEGRTSANSNMYFLGTGASGATNAALHFGYRSNTAFTLAQYANDLDCPVPAYTTQTFRLWDAMLDTASGHYVAMNGAGLVCNTNVTPFVSAANGKLGQAAFDASRQYLGDIAEVLIYNSALSPSERIAVEAYLNAKWLGIGTSNLLPSATAVDITAAGATLDLNHVNQKIGSLSGVAGSLVTLGTGNLTVGDATSTTFAGEISGVGMLSKQGGGTLTLSGVNTYEGGTTVNAGALRIDAAAALPAGGALTIGEGGTVVLGQGLAAGGAAAASQAAAPVPEPSTLALLAVALVALSAGLWRRHR